MVVIQPLSTRFIKPNFCLSPQIGFKPGFILRLFFQDSLRLSRFHVQSAVAIDHLKLITNVQTTNITVQK